MNKSEGNKINGLNNYEDTVWKYSSDERFQGSSSSVMYQPPPVLSTAQHTTIIHSSIKPVPDSDIYK